MSSTSEQRIARNKAHVLLVRASTVCASCGGQPIEWHRPEHTGAEWTQQIGRLTNKQVSIAHINAEIARCTPYCRWCHARITKAGPDGLERCRRGHPRTVENTYVYPDG